MAAVVGADRSLWRDDVGIFPPGTPLANDAGLEALTGGRDPDRVKRELSEAGYAGEKVVLLAATDFPTLSAVANVGAETLRRVGMDVEVVAAEWSALIQRRARRPDAAAGRCSSPSGPGST
jgi:peptide/nickel transport system substrate-binding protein